MSDSSPPLRLLDPDAPTSPRLRAMLAALRPSEPTDEADERIEARIFQTDLPALTRVSSAQRTGSSASL